MALPGLEGREAQGMPVFPSLSLLCSHGWAGVSAAHPSPHLCRCAGQKEGFFCLLFSSQQLSKGDGGRVADASAADLVLLLADKVPD